MREPFKVRGQPASSGYASGPLWQPRSAATPIYKRGANPGEEMAALDRAMAMAREQTARFVAASHADAAEIMEFQLAMLEDESFRTASASRIAEGASAYEAWRQALSAEIEDYLASSDESFRARSTDLADIRDRVLGALTGAGDEKIPGGSIVLADDIAPSTFVSNDWTGAGLALRQGSANGHVAILARQRGVPLVVGLGAAKLKAGSYALLDAVAGELLLEPGKDDLARFDAARRSFGELRLHSEKHAAGHAITADGTVIKILVNIADPRDTESIPVANVDGVGLMRTEFLFANGQPGEEAQYQAYRKVLEWAHGKPVTIRTIDAGGDKPVEGMTEAEANPFLGMRGIRLSLAKPEIFSVQIRALLRAARHGNLKVMLPMVAVPEEIDQAEEYFAKEAEALGRAGIPFAIPPIGIMVEVPSVAILPERFAKAAFFSIGSNDLVQYTLAVSRDNWRLAGLARNDDPSVLSLIARVAAYGAVTGHEVGLCGDAASSPEMVPHLLKAGLRILSISTASIGSVKAAIARCDLGRSG